MGIYLKDRLIDVADDRMVEILLFLYRFIVCLVSFVLG